MSGHLRAKPTELIEGRPHVHSYGLGGAVLQPGMHPASILPPAASYVWPGIYTAPQQLPPAPPVYPCLSQPASSGPLLGGRKDHSFQAPPGINAELLQMVQRLAPKEAAIFSKPTPPPPSPLPRALAAHPRPPVSSGLQAALPTSPQRSSLALRPHPPGSLAPLRPEPMEELLVAPQQPPPPSSSNQSGFSTNQSPPAHPHLQPTMSLSAAPPSELAAAAAAQHRASLAVGGVLSKASHRQNGRRAPPVRGLA